MREFDAPLLSDFWTNNCVAVAWNAMTPMCQLLYCDPTVWKCLLKINGPYILTTMNYPANIVRNIYVIITSKWRFDVIITYLLRSLYLSGIHLRSSFPPRSFPFPSGRYTRLRMRHLWRHNQIHCCNGMDMCGPLQTASLLLQRYSNRKIYDVVKSEIPTCWQWNSGKKFCYHSPLYKGCRHSATHFTNLTWRGVTEAPFVNFFVTGDFDLTKV